MGKQIIVDVKFGADGSVDEQGTRDAFNTLFAKLVAQVKEDHDSVAVEVMAFLVENPGLRTISTAHLVRALWERKIESGAMKGKSQEEKSLAYARLEEVVPEYVKANPDMFHTGRKTGIAIRGGFPGDILRNEDGSTKYDANGKEQPNLRHSDEEWAKLTAKKEKPATDSANAAQ